MKNNGKQGEALFKQRLENSGYSVQDVSNNPEYWYKDIDFIVTSPVSQLTRTFEVKYDSRINSTGNMYLELTNVNSKGGRGWYEFCEADFLAYGDARAQIFYIVPLADLKERVKKLAPRVARCAQDSTGLLVSIDSISDLIKII